MPERGKGPEAGVPESSASSEAILFGKYELGKLLGYGASAKVYHARNVRTGHNVAIKVLSKQKLHKGGLMAQVMREIAIMHGMRHPHIVKLLEVLATKTKIYLVLEFARGGELFTKIAKGRFSEDLSRRYFQQLISAVGYCHSRGVFHRDLKPENLLLDENWGLKVTDFGLSAVKDQIQPDGLLHTLCGTPAYVAPEILSKKGYDGAKVDIWSCGIILYVLNSGYLPFNDPNLMVMYRKIYKGEFRYPKWTSPDLRRFISRLLDVNPQTRITIDEILQDPWFRKGYKEIEFHNENDEGFDLKDCRDSECGKHLNAFDLISLSPGFHISGLFSDSDTAVRGERFLSEETPETIIERISEVAQREGLIVTKKDCCAKLEGQNGNFVAMVEVYRLTESLVVVVIRRRERDVGPSQQIWKDTLRPQIDDLVYHREPPVSDEL